MKTKIYGFNNGGSPGWYGALAITEHGKALCSHVCSHEGFMRHDLGMDGQSNWKHDVYDKYCPEGWETEFVPSCDIEKHEGLQAALKLAKDSKIEEPASVTIEVG